MRIYRMTATFGKLEHETLTLEPGLNIIEAPNEWGKSTWCAFLLAMLYGLDTRAKSTKTNLADKDRYAPWSGSPMEGRIDLNWQGKDITIQRRTARRVPLGEFSAYETQTGLPVPELTAANCGQMLLGVERTVFRRAGFIRLTDLPVTQDEALRRRLNDLVTTGDETGSADRLAEGLKDLRNRCRYNKSGLLPQAEAERSRLEGILGELTQLEEQKATTGQQLEDVKLWLEKLTNHQQALAYAAAQSNVQRVEQAREELEKTEKKLRELEEICRNIPSREESERNIRELRSFREQWNNIQMEIRLLPSEPEEPQMTPPFAGMTPDDARQMVVSDTERFRTVSARGFAKALLLVTLLGLAAMGLLLFMKAYVPGAVSGAVALATLLWSIGETVSTNKERRKLVEKYGSGNCRLWADPITLYEQEKRIYDAAFRDYQESSGDVDVRLMVLNKRRENLCGQEDPEILLEKWQRILEAWDHYYSACRERDRAQNHFEDIAALVKPVNQPNQPDTLDHNEAQTAQLLAECAQEQQRLQNRLGQYQGRMETLGDKASIRAKLDQVYDRIAQLEEQYAALNIALETLDQARAELQRRFAPRITKRAKELLAAMTAGRYCELSIGQDFSLQAGTEEENTLRDILWRSDGTVDQLYLALRLAVAEELTPEALLILDDALVRFDDTRLASAVQLLKQMAQERQVILFTCQGREKLTLQGE